MSESGAPKTSYQAWQETVWGIVQPDFLDGVLDWKSRIFDIAILALIVTSIAGVILNSVESVQSEYGAVLDQLELVAVVLFTIEYALRLWSCPTEDRWTGELGSRLQYALSPLAIVDLLAIMPFYLALFAPEWAPALLAARMLRLLKLGHYFPSLRLIIQAFDAKKQFFLASGFLAVVIVLVAAVLLYTIEGDVQEGFADIPKAMWWAIVTLTTVGYGDVSPTTGFGQVVGGIVGFCGIPLMAVPGGFLAVEYGSLLATHLAGGGKPCARCPYLATVEDHYCAQCGEKLPG